MAAATSAAEVVTAAEVMDREDEMEMGADDVIGLVENPDDMVSGPSSPCHQAVEKAEDSEMAEQDLGEAKEASEEAMHATAQMDTVEVETTKEMQ